MKKVTMIFLAAATLLCGTLAAAGDLTPAVIDRWMATITALEGEKANLPGNDAFEMGDDEHGDVAVMYQQLETHLTEEMERHNGAMVVLRQHGFSSSADWAATYMQITRAYGALQMEAQGDWVQVDEQMRQALEQLDNNPHLSDVQKAQFRQQMATATDVMNSYTRDVPAADKAAVRSRMHQLQTLFDAE